MSVVEMKRTAGLLISPLELESGDYITFTDKTSGVVRQAFFIGMLDESNDTFICVGESHNGKIGTGYVGQGRVVKVDIRWTSDLLITGKKIREIMEV
jgi:hypothetical protein